jgi:MFS family permease
LPSAASILAPYRGLPRRVWAIAGLRAINTFGFSMVMPFMAMYLVTERDLPAKVGGTMYLLAGLAAAFSQGIAGELADRLGRRRLMAGALALRAANMIALGLAVHGHASIHALGALIVVNGVLRASFEPAAQAALVDAVDEQNRVAAFGLQRMGVNLGWAMGPALGGAFAHGGGYGLLFFVSAPVLVGASLWASRLSDVPRPVPAASLRWRRDVVRKALRQYPAFFVCLGFALVGATLTNQLFSTLTIFLRAELGWSEGGIGSIYTINGILVILLQVPAVALIERGGARVALVAGPLLYALAFVGFGLSTGYGAFAACIAVLTLGEILYSPALSDLAAHLGDPQRMGRAFGLFGLAQTLGVSMGPLVGGAVFDALREHQLTMWLVFAGGMVLLAAGYAVFLRRVRLRLIVR